LININHRYNYACLQVNPYSNTLIPYDDTPIGKSTQSPIKPSYMRKLLFLLFALPLVCYAQDELPRIIKDTLLTTSGYRMVAGTDVKLGTGTLPNGDFKYVAISSASWVNISDPSMSKMGISRRYNGHLVHVKKFRKDGNNKRGYVFYAVVGGGNIVNYDIDVESAIAAGELVVPNQFRPKAANAAAQPSPADEIKKLKDLLEKGAISQNEYDSAKKKILDKM
jgi:hypothetical protein